jgi:hypothetical protein
LPLADLPKEGFQDMDVYEVKSVEISAVNREQDKQKWAEEHARHLQQMFEQWQKPLGIDGAEYRRHLREELTSYCDEPLLKSLIESIT